MQSTSGRPSKEQLEKAFHVFVKNKNKLISVDDLRHILSHLGNKKLKEQFTDEHLDEIFKELGGHKYVIENNVITGELQVDADNCIVDTIYNTIVKIHTGKTVSDEIIEILVPSSDIKDHNLNTCKFNSGVYHIKLFRNGKFDDEYTSINGVLVNDTDYHGKNNKTVDVSVTINGKLVDNDALVKEEHDGYIEYKMNGKNVTVIKGNLVGLNKDIVTSVNGVKVNEKIDIIRKPKIIKMINYEDFIKKVMSYY